MTRVQQSAAGILFAAVLILGGWAWSQDDRVASPGDVTAASVDPATEGAAADGAPTDDLETDGATIGDAETGDPETEGATADDPKTDAADADAPESNGAAADSPATDRSSVVDAAVPAAPTANASATVGLRGMIFSLWIFVLAVFLGIEVISKVPPTLHTPLMSGSNAISGITLVGAVIVAAAVVNGLSSNAGIFARFLGFIAVALAMTNAVGGFLVTHRMLAMFTRK